MFTYSPRFCVMMLSISYAASLSAFAGFASYFRFGTIHAKTIVIDGTEYSTEGLPKIYASKEKHICNVSKTNDLVGSSRENAIPITTVAADTKETYGIPLIALTKTGEGALKITVRSGESMGSEYPFEPYAAHPLIAYLKNIMLPPLPQDTALKQQYEAIKTHME